MRADHTFSGRLPLAAMRLARSAALLALHVLFPRTCPHCREDLPFREEGPLCRGCEDSLEPIPELCCGKCGLPLDSGGELCPGCRRSGGPAISGPVRSAFAFGPAVRSLVHAFKYRGRAALAEPLGLRMARAYDLRPELKPYNFVVPVPLFGDREKERGFNQSALLAGILAREKGLFLLEGAAERTRGGLPQAGLSRKERRANVKGMFRVPDPALVRGRRILIVDDVATTLSTVEELAAALSAAGADATAVFTLAREPVKEKEGE
ncbi:MAG TPA: ComF family protein [Elusimicrobiales bacterium]|nr:ComF family protein [Elusimicrobiales bacterium]